MPLLRITSRWDCLGTPQIWTRVFLVSSFDNRGAPGLTSFGQRESRHHESRQNETAPVRRTELTPSRSQPATAKVLQPWRSELGAGEGSRSMGSVAKNRADGHKRRVAKAESARPGRSEAGTWTASGPRHAIHGISRRQRRAVAGDLPARMGSGDAAVPAWETLFPTKRYMLRGNASKLTCHHASEELPASSMLPRAACGALPSRSEFAPG